MAEDREKLNAMMKKIDKKKKPEPTPVSGADSAAKKPITKPIDKLAPDTDANPPKFDFKAAQ